MDIGLDGALLATWMGIFVYNEKGSQLWHVSLQQIINPASHREADIPFGSGFPKELRVILKTWRFFYGLVHDHAINMCRITQRSYFDECPQLFTT